MEKEELKNTIFAFVEKAKGKKKLKEKDIIKGVSAASSVEIPSEEYLREKGMIK
ncbi:MAG: hypothetical protein P8Y75_05900 [Nitrospirota bacterium]